MLEDLLKFVRLTHAFQKISRIVLVQDEERYENDAEHTFQLALAAYYLIDRDHLSFSLEKVMGYALVHDLVEVYAGDTYVFADEQAQASKAARENAAAEKLREEFPEFPSLHELIHNYESRADPESIFIYALDKLLPVLNIYLDSGRLWTKTGINLKELRKVKDSKIASSPEVEKYWNELLVILNAHPELFA